MSKSARGTRAVVSRAQARALKHISARMDRQGGGVPLETVRREWLDDMAAELRKMAKAFVRTRKGGVELLEALGIAKVEGVDPAVVSEVIGMIGEKLRRRKAA